MPNWQLLLVVFLSGMLAYMFYQHVRRVGWRDALTSWASWVAILIVVFFTFLLIGRV